MEKEELIIDEKNFNIYFKEVNKNRPDKGDVIACYRARAYLVDGELKRNVVDLLKIKGGTESAIKMLIKSAYCLEQDAINISKSICKDLVSGVSEIEILGKEYPYTLEIFYYTKEENIPKDDKHWTIMKIVN